MIHIPKFHAPIPFPWSPKRRTEAHKLSGVTTAAVSVALLAGLVSLATSSGQAPVTNNLAEVQNRVVTLANSWDPDLDPLVEVREGVVVKQSNISGVKVGSDRYYYRMPYSTNYDPVSRGIAKEYKVVSVVDAGTPWEIIIYRLTG